MLNTIFIIAKERLAETVIYRAQPDNPNYQFIYQGDLVGKRIFCVFSLIDESTFDFAHTQYVNLFEKGEDVQMIGIDKGRGILRDSFKHKLDSCGAILMQDLRMELLDNEMKSIDLDNDLQEYTEQKRKACCCAIQ